MNIHAKLAMLRKKKGLTQLQLSEQMNVSRQAISRWELGLSIPNTDNLKFLSDLYKVPVDDLLNDDVDAFVENAAMPDLKIPYSNSENSSQMTKSTARYIMQLQLCIVALLVVLAVILTVMFIPKENTDPSNTGKVHQIKDLPSDEETDDTTYYTFPLEWWQEGR